MPFLFHPDISDWPSWGRVYQSIDDWKPLIRHVYSLHALPLSEVEPLTPGTNAVFKVGDTVVKIFAPVESGLDTRSDFAAESYGLRWADVLGIAVPHLCATGCIRDKYAFHYMVMDHIAAASLSDIGGTLTAAEKEAIGYQLRDICDRLNGPCAPFNSVNVVERALSSARWNGFSPDFIREKNRWLTQHRPEDCVFVHGDLNPDNLLIDPTGNMHVIDFADSVRAPADYELAAIVCEAFAFDASYIRGFFGADYAVSDIADRLFHALLLHDFGADMIRANLAPPQDIPTLDALRERIHSAIATGKTTR